MALAILFAFVPGFPAVVKLKTPVLEIIGHLRPEYVMKTFSYKEKILVKTMLQDLGLI